MRRLAFLVLPLGFLLACSDASVPTATDEVASQFNTTGAGQIKAELCHRNADGSYNLITIGEPAFDAHVAHGDASPWHMVPGMPGYMFDDACVPVPACPCFDWVPLDQIDWFLPGTWLIFLEGADVWGPKADLVRIGLDGGGATSYYAFDSIAYCGLYDYWAGIEAYGSDIGDAAAEACRGVIRAYAIDLGCPSEGGNCYPS